MSNGSLFSKALEVYGSATTKFERCCQKQLYA
jgi:hypothetical protein